MSARNGVACLIPAAGRGSRLGEAGPKILLPLAEGLVVWDVLAARLAPHAARLHVVLSPQGVSPFVAHLAARGPSAVPVTHSVQPVPRGMGDAVFGAREAFSDCDTLLLVWGDQVSLSTDTVRRTLEQHAVGRGPRLTIPIVRVTNPYVEYVFDPSDRLTAVLQSREGESCSAVGFSDVGVFCLTTEGLPSLWDAYAAGAGAGEATGELNFLPFLSHLSMHCGVRVARVAVSDASESRGINTKEDLAFFRERAARDVRGS